MAPTIIYDDIVGFLNATTSGTSPNRTLTFYKDTASEATVNQHIQSAADYLHFAVGDTIWTASDAVQAPAVKRLFLLYAVCQVLTVLSGGLILSGFNVVMGDLNLAKSERFNVYHSLISDFSGEAEGIYMQLTQFHLAKTGGSSRI